jgi:uncharacterized protein YjbI with pentapeptide repeats
MTTMPGRDWIRRHKKTVAAAALGAVLLVVVALGIFWFGWDWKALFGWRALVHDINPVDATDRKDTVQVYAIIVAGVVGALTALAAVGNLIISRRNLQNARETLQQQRQLDERRAQDDALQSYFQQIGELLTEHELKEAKPEDAVASLARAQTHTVVARLDARGKRALLLFLYGARLIFGVDAVVDLFGADFSGADLKRSGLGAGVNLRGANPSSADLRHAFLGDAILSGAILYKADLRDAGLGDARLMAADLRACLASNRVGLGGAESAPFTRGTASRGPSLRGGFLRFSKRF